MTEERKKERPYTGLGSGTISPPTIADGVCAVASGHWESLAWPNYTACTNIHRQFVHSTTTHPMQPLQACLALKLDVCQPGRVEFSTQLLLASTQHTLVAPSNRNNQHMHSDKHMLTHMHRLNN